MGNKQEIHHLRSEEERSEFERRKEFTRLSKSCCHPTFPTRNIKTVYISLPHLLGEESCPPVFQGHCDLLTHLELATASHC